MAASELGRRSLTSDIYRGEDVGCIMDIRIGPSQSDIVQRAVVVVVVVAAAVRMNARASANAKCNTESFVVTVKYPVMVHSHVKSPLPIVPFSN